MFNYKKSGKGVINGKWYVYFLNANGDEIIFNFLEEEYQAFEKAEALNNALKSFLELIKKS